MLSTHSRDRVSAPPAIIMLAKAGIGHGMSDPALTTGARIQ